MTHITEKRPMKQFSKYASDLEKLTLKVLRFGLNDRINTELKDVLDNQPNSALRQHVPLYLRRKHGAFFTGRSLVDKLLLLLPDLSKENFYCDPTCGAGDLLLGVCRKLPLKQSLSDTLAFWGEHIIGWDINEEFVLTTKARLVLLAAQRCASRAVGEKIQWKEVFPQVICEDGFLALKRLAEFEQLVILLNPPYSSVSAPEDCEWSRGKTNFGALFLEACLKNCRPGTRIAAILPDVLRSGSRYTKWRQLVNAYSTDRRLRTEDLFDESTDINVYLTSLIVRDTKQNVSSTNARLTKSHSHHTLRVGDLFRVNVGPVVPHRHRRSGKSYPYLHARTAKAWKLMKSIAESRRFRGTVYQPPFVVVRRTSRPGDKYRGIGTIVTGSSPIAVENHLLVISPVDGTLDTCKRLLKSLKSKETSRWLDRRIRCRHLTVEAIEGMPLFLWV